MSKSGTYSLDTSALVGSLTTDDLTIVLPVAGNINLAGGTNINTTGAGATATVNLDATITLTRVNATTFDTNVVAAGLEIAGTTISADGTDADINITLTPKGTGEVLTNALNATSYVITDQFYTSALDTGLSITDNDILADGTDADIDLNISAKGTGQVIIDDLQLTTDLAVPYGGTGASTFTDGGLLVGAAAAAIEALAVGGVGTILTGVAGANPTWTTATYPATTVQGDVIYSSAANTVVGLAKDATATRYLANTGATNNPAWDQVNLANGVTGTLTVPNGGTGLATITDHGVLLGQAGAAVVATAAGTAGYVLESGGAAADPTWQIAPGNIDIDNMMYVGKHGNDANDGLSPAKAKLTIQAAVTAAAAGDTVIVYPGTYTETVTHAANNLTMIAEGKPNSCIITQADANVINFATFAGIQYKFFQISCTAATTAIWTIAGTTGSCGFKECQLSMTCAAAIAAVNQPGVARVTGAGTLNVIRGKVFFYHTGAGGGTANKGAFSVGNGGMVNLKFIDEIEVINSGTALVSGVGIDTASTGNFTINDCKIEVTDPNATIVVGLAYLGGTGTDNEFHRNVVHVTATNNIAYGFFSADTASSSRFFYNHIHVEDAAGSSYSFLIGATSTVISQFDDIVADDGYSLTATGIFYQTNSEIDGDLTCSGPLASGTRNLEVANTDNTATASNSAVNISVGGATSTGDPYTNYLVTGAGTYSVGIDNSVAGDPFKITSGATPSAGTDLFTMTNAGVITLNNDLDVSEGGTGVSTLSASGVLLGQGAANITALTPGTAGTILQAAGGVADPAWTTATYPATTIIGDLLVSSAANVITALNPSTAGHVLTDGGVGAAPSWQAASAGVVTSITGGANITVTGTAAIPIVSLDASPSVAGSVTAATGMSITTGDLDIISGSMTLPATTADDGAIWQDDAAGTLYPFIHTYGNNGASNSYNLFIGHNAGNFTLTAGTSRYNVALGDGSLASSQGCLHALTTGERNFAIGYSTLRYLTEGSNNVSIGMSSSSNLVTGNWNLTLGSQSGSSLTTNDSDNLFLSNVGTAGDNNKIIIGTQGTGDGQQNSCQVAGIYGVTPGGTINAALVDSNGVLGSVASLTVPYGGTGASTFTDGGLLVGAAAGPIEALAVGGVGTILTGVAGSNPTWTTATYPATAAIGTILVASGANVITTIAPDTAGHVLTDGGAGAAPSWQAAGGGTVDSITGGANITVTGTAAIPIVSLDAAITGITSITMADTGVLRTTVVDTDVMSIQAYDVDGTAYVDFITLTNANDPTCDLNTGVTIGTKYIYRADGTDVPVADGGTGASTFTDHGVLVGAGVGAITPLAVGTNGQVLVGSSAADPIFATIASTDGSISYTLGAGTLDIEGTAAGEAQVGVVELATDAEAIAGTATTVINCTSLKAKLGAQTSHGLPYGAATTGAIAWTAEPSDGQFLIGDTAAIPQLGTITAGTGVTVTNAAHAITVASTGTTLNTQTDSYTLVIGDAGKMVKMNKATANTLTIPKNSAVAFVIGTEVLIMQYGAGATTIAPVDGDVTVRYDAALTLVLNAQYALGACVKIAEDEWICGGNLTAA